MDSRKSDLRFSDFVIRSSFVISASSFVLLDQLRQQIADNPPLNIREPEIAPIISISQLFMIETEDLQDGRVQVMHMNFILHRGPAKFIRCAVDGSTFDASASQPHAEAA